MFVSSEDFVAEHSGRIGDIAIYGQELNTTTWRLAKMNMAIRGIDADIRQGDTLQDDKLRDLKFDYILANPPFNISDWGQARVQDDVRWQYGLPPAGNANYAWIQHIIHHLSPRGVSGFVMANGTMTTNTSGEGDIRRRIVEGGLPAGRQGLVDCIIACPDKLFFNVTLPCCLWFVSRDRLDRKGKTLFIDARKLGFMESRKTRNLAEDDIRKITAKYHEFIEKGDTAAEPSFAKVSTLDEIAKNDFALTPGLYVGSEVVEDDGDLDQQIADLKAELLAGFAKGRELEEKIIYNLKEI
jgi:type I restriction enzyme M protein